MLFRRAFHSQNQQQRDRRSQCAACRQSRQSKRRLKRLFNGCVAGCPMHFTSPNSPSKRVVLGTVPLSVLAGHRRYAHITALRCDSVNPPLLGMQKVVSEDAVRRGFDKIDEEAGLSWQQEHLDYCTRPLLSEPWILDVDTTVKPLYGHQEGAVVSYNPHKPGRPSHSFHSYILANLRLVLGSPFGLIACASLRLKSS